MIRSAARVLKRITIITFAFAFMMNFSATDGYALTCQQVRQLTVEYLKMHFAFDTFDENLSKRTLENLTKAWDPGKLFFYESDIEDLRKQYGSKLHTMINSGNCSAIERIASVYSRRFEERHRYVSNLIDQKHDFTVDEHIDLDRRNLEYAKTQEEVNERWRQRVKFQLLQLLLTDVDEKTAKKRLASRYQRAVRRHNEQTIEETYSLFLNAFSTALDPHSQYMPARELEDFRINTRLSLEGIGAVLRSEDGFTIIQSLVPGGAALKSGKLQVDDKIIAVAQGDSEPVDVIDMDLREVVRLIRGTRGTTVTLTVLRGEGGEARKARVPIVREQIQLEDRIAKSQVIELEVKANKATETLRLGVINLPSFYVDFEGMHAKQSDYRSSARDVAKELEKLKKEKVDGVVLDLRNNGGGSLEESIKVAGLFIDKGPIVQIKAMDGRTFPHSVSEAKALYDGPLVVMINRQSASASEILAGAIQDMQRGLIVGDSHTFGKGTVQNLNDMGDKLGATKITISKFYRPSGSSTQLRGVESDIVFPSLADQIEIGEKHYDYALPWEQIKGSEYKNFNVVVPYLAKLKERSESRVAEDEGFAKIREQIKEFKEKESERYRFSLKLADHKEDEKQDDKLAEKADEEMEAALGSNEAKLEDDYYLQETLKISGDYVRLLSEKNLGLVTIPQLTNGAAAVADTKAAKSSAAVKDSSKSTQP